MFVGLWAVVNNAGTVCATVPVEWFKKEDFLRVLEVNTLGGIDVTIQCLPLVKKSKGRIVLVASLSGYMSLPTFAPYSISKYGVEAFGDCLR